MRTRIYEASLSQSGTTNPEVLTCTDERPENMEAVYWRRIAPGTFIFQDVGEDGPRVFFPLGTTCYVSDPHSAEGVASTQVLVDTTGIVIYTRLNGVLTDGLLTNTSVLIRMPQHLVRSEQYVTPE